MHPPLTLPDIDGHLDTLTDDGEKAVFLNHCIDRAEAALSRLDPVSVEASDTDDLLGALETRLDNLRGRIKARIATAEMAMGAV